MGSSPRLLRHHGIADGPAFLAAGVMPERCALDAGFGDLSTFNKTFRVAFGLTPTQYRASGL